MNGLFALAAAPWTLAAAARNINDAAVYLLAFLAALCILIFVHEFGHFVVARRLGVGVTKFSFGFGPRLFGFRRGETEYLVSAVPFGGYVKLVGESEGEETSPEVRDRSFFAKPAWVKIAVVAAGPAGNLVFAFLVFWAVFVWGSPVPTARIDVAPGTPAAKAGLAGGDLVTGVDGHPVAHWDDLDRLIREGTPGRPMALAVRRDGREIPVTVIPEFQEGRNELGEAVRETGIGVAPFFPAVIGDVVRGDPAARAGVKAGDAILKVDGTPVANWEEMASRIRKTPPGGSVTLTLRRGAREFDLAVAPEMQEIPGKEGKKVREPKIGIVPGPEMTRMRLGPVRAFLRAGERTGSLMALTVEVVVKLVMRVVPAKTLGGPILIAQIAGDQARQGFPVFVLFLGFLSINLGILNLLPIPILDGGHILFYAIEWLRRKPLSPQARELAQQVGLAIILMLVVLVFYNDIARLVAR